MSPFPVGVLSALRRSVRRSGRFQQPVSVDGLALQPGEYFKRLKDIRNTALDRPMLSEVSVDGVLAFLTIPV